MVTISKPLTAGKSDRVENSDEAREGLPVRLEGLSKVYQSGEGPLQALKSTTLTIRGGEFFSVVGPSGCGKSTLLMLLGGLIPPTQGRIFVGDEEVTQPYTDLGFVFQRDVLMDWRSVRSNVLLPVEIKKLKPPEAYRARADELLKMVGLEGFEESYPSELSGGMRQRVCISRALITRPPLLLMDEPFGALDAITRDQMNDDLLKVWSKNRNTVIFVTHNIDEAIYLSDRVLVMSKRPGQVLDIVDVSDLPKPRSAAIRKMAEFTAHTSRIREIFMNQGILAAS